MFIFISVTLVVISSISFFSSQSFHLSAHVTSVLPCCLLFPLEAQDINHSYFGQSDNSKIFVFWFSCLLCILRWCDKQCFSVMFYVHLTINSRCALFTSCRGLKPRFFFSIFIFVFRVVFGFPWELFLKQSLHLEVLQLKFSVNISTQELC